MILRVVMASLLLLSARPALAETVRVRSGEHAQFSRIVLVFKAPVTWSHRKTATGFEVQFDRTDLKLDLSEIFNLIPRDRIQSVDFDEVSGRLSIRSDCDCSIEVFRAGGSTIAIDVATASDPNDREAALDRVADPMPFGLPQAPKFGSPMGGRAGHRAADATGRAMPPEAPGAPKSTAIERHHIYASLEEALMRQLGRAASQGLATVRTPDPNLPAGLADEPGAGSASEARHVATETAIDRATHALGASAPDPMALPVCLDPALLDPLQWAAAPVHVGTLSKARLDLLDARDRPESSAVEQLVRTYLALGFGAEALAVMTEFSDTTEIAPAYAAVAAVLEDRTAPRPNPLLGQERCSGPTAIWAVLAAEDPNGLGNVDTAAVQEAFFSFPKDLRRDIGPILVRKLFEAGYVDAAGTVRNAAERSSGTQNADLVLLDATTEIAPAKKDEAMAALSTIVEQNGTGAAVAANELLKSSIANGRVDPDHVVLCEALAVEHSGETVGNELRANAARARAALGDFETAFLHHEQLAKRAPQSEHATDPILSEIVTRMVAADDDIELLEFVLYADERPAWARLDPATRRMAIGRLLDFGLWRPAERLLAANGVVRSIEDRTLAARISLLRHDPSLALTLIAGEEEPDTTGIRAASLSRLGEHGSAATLQSKIGNRRDAAVEAWLSGNADLIGEFGSEAEKAFARHRSADAEGTTRPPPPAEMEVSLERVRADLKDSETMRAVLGSLLGELKDRGIDGGE